MPSPVRTSTLYMLHLCMRLCVCVCARAYACVCARMSVCGENLLCTWCTSLCVRDTPFYVSRACVCARISVRGRILTICERAHKLGNAKETEAEGREARDSPKILTLYIHTNNIHMFICIPIYLHACIGRERVKILKRFSRGRVTYVPLYVPYMSPYDMMTRSCLP